MTDAPKQAGNRGKGRKKGVPNKMTAIAKDVIAYTAEGLGAGPGLLKWAKADAKNEHAFWTIIYPKLLPLQVAGPGQDGEHIIHTIVREVVRPNAQHPDS